MHMTQYDATYLKNLRIDVFSWIKLRRSCH